MSATKDEVQRVLEDLRGQFSADALTLASMANAIGTFCPPELTPVMSTLGLCVRARAIELGLDPKEVARAIAAVRKANHTLAILNCEPSDVEVDLNILQGNTPRF